MFDIGNFENILKLSTIHRHLVYTPMTSCVDQRRSIYEFENCANLH